MCFLQFRITFIHFWRRKDKEKNNPIRNIGIDITNGIFNLCKTLMRIETSTISFLILYPLLLTRDIDMQGRGITGNHALKESLPFLIVFFVPSL